jgi:hypothetical protein
VSTGWGDIAVGARTAVLEQLEGAAEKFYFGAWELGELAKKTELAGDDRQASAYRTTANEQLALAEAHRAAAAHLRTPR